MTIARTGFTGFRPAAFQFLEGLRDNNDPGWFKPRKAIYESEVLAPFGALIAAVSTVLSDVGIPLAGDPRRAIFRIYRDVRFSADKRLYKTHAGAVLTRSGSKRDPGLLYLHVEPDKSMVAAGFWHPEPPLLLRLRRAIAAGPEEFLGIADRLAGAGFAIGSDRQLSRLPRGFDAVAGTPRPIMSAGSPSQRGRRSAMRTCSRLVLLTASSHLHSWCGRCSNGAGRRWMTTPRRPYCCRGLRTGCRSRTSNADRRAVSGSAPASAIRPRRDPPAPPHLCGSRTRPWRRTGR